MTPVHAVIQALISSRYKFIDRKKNLGERAKKNELKIPEAWKMMQLHAFFMHNLGKENCKMSEVLRKKCWESCSPHIINCIKIRPKILHNMK